MTESTWKKCSNCKRPIAFKQTYWVCNVSTCNRVRTGLQFCSVECWDAHVPLLRHRESWAEERRAPSSLSDSEAPVTRKRDETIPSAAVAQTAVPTAPPPSPPRAILRKKSSSEPV